MNFNSANCASKVLNSVGAHDRRYVVCVDMAAVSQIGSSKKTHLSHITSCGSPLPTYPPYFVKISWSGAGIYKIFCLLCLLVAWILYKLRVCCVSRLIWLVIFLVASVLFVYLVAVKFIYLLSYPKNVNVDFNFNSSLPFPAVTICNESPYRYSQTYFRINVM